MNADIQHGQMLTATGKPLSRILDVTRPEQFASLMHNVDSEIWRSPRCPFPTAIRDLADGAVASDEPAIIDAVENLYAQGRELSYGRVSLTWRLPENTENFINACRASGDLALSSTADFLVSLSGLPPNGVDNILSDEESLERWEMLADAKKESPSPKR